MKAKLTEIVQTEEIIKLNYSTDQFASLFLEIISVFETLEQRLNDIESGPSINDQIQSLQRENRYLKAQVEELQTNTNGQVKNLEKLVEASISETQKKTDASIDRCMAETRRFCNNEIRGLMTQDMNQMGNLDEITTNLAAQVERINNLDQQIEALSGSLSSKTTLEEINKVFAPIQEKFHILDELQEDMLGLHIQLSNAVAEGVAPQQSLSQYKDILGDKIPKDDQSSQPMISFRPVEPLDSEVVIPDTPPLTSTALEDLKNTINQLSSQANLQTQRMNSMTQALNINHVQLSQEFDELSKRFNGLNDKLTGVQLRVDATSKDCKNLHTQINDHIKQFQQYKEDKEKETKFIQSRNRVPFNDLNVEESPQEKKQITLKIETKAAEKPQPQVAPPKPVEKPPPPSKASESSTSSPLQKTRSPIEVPHPADNLDSYPSEHSKSSHESATNAISKHASRKMSGSIPQLQHVTVSQEEINQKVDNAMKFAIEGLVERIEEKTQKKIAKSLKVVETVQALLETKVDAEFVERMFNKFRVIIGELKERQDQMNSTFLGWVTREELEEVLSQFVGTLQEVQDTAGVRSRYKCLLCGKPRTHMAGMMIDESQSPVVGASANARAKSSSRSHRSGHPKDPVPNVS